VLSFHTFLWFTTIKPFLKWLFAPVPTLPSTASSTTVGGGIPSIESPEFPEWAAQPGNFEKLFV
jgi:hypothetical protein